MLIQPIYVHNCPLVRIKAITGVFAIKCAFYQYPTSDAHLYPYASIFSALFSVDLSVNPNKTHVCTFFASCNHRFPFIDMLVIQEMLC